MTPGSISLSARTSNVGFSFCGSDWIVRGDARLSVTSELGLALREWGSAVVFWTTRPGAAPAFRGHTYSEKAPGAP
jgi:hypothetical protein